LFSKSIYPVVVLTAMDNHIFYSERNNYLDIRFFSACNKEIIAEPQKEGDAITAFLFMEILKDEEDHHDTFTALLEQV